MGVRNVLLSLTTNDNDYQLAQAEAANVAARSHGFHLEVQFSENDAVLQVQRILGALQSKNQLYDAIISEPVGTAMEQAARLAVKNGVVWGILNHATSYVHTLRQTESKTAVFEVTSDHFEIGRIQGYQAAAVLPEGGLALYLEGPATGGAARLRTEGIMSTKPRNIELKMMKGDWTQSSMRRSFSAWLSLSTSRKLGVAAIISQNDAMALGAREAIENTLSGFERQHWLSLPVTGCDGLPNGGQSLVQRGILTATIAVSPNSGPAIELLAKAFRGEQIPERSLGTAASFPPLEKLSRALAAY
jgi:ABC-type sugar transport system substrate-binding protein